MRDKDKFDKGIFMTGDGDFHVLFEYLMKQKKQMSVIANGKRTAKEIRILIGPNFTPMKSLKGILEQKKR